MLKFDSIVDDLMLHKNLDMLDKTKCSLTAKNIYNYILKNFGIGDEEELEISWNDTLNTEHINLDQFVQMDKTNKMFYVYYDHFTGETSHYFILIFNEKNQFRLLQSAVFEYNVADWLNLQGIDDKNKNNDYDSDRQYFYNIMLKKNETDVRYTKKLINDSCLKNIVDFNEDIINKFRELEGSWHKTCVKKCQLFEQMFACKMDSYKLEKLLKFETKKAVFKFKATQLCKIEL